MQRMLGELNVESLSESFDLEMKKALGRDGRGSLPASYWETYSAMANTDGGLVLLGIEEGKTAGFKVVGIPEPEKVVKAIWDGANNRQCVSVNLLSNRSIEAYDVGDDRTVLSTRIPRARRDQRPVHVGSDAFTGSYRRGFEGDYLCEAETVRRMYAERVEDARDARLLPGFFIEDLDLESVQSYRNMLATSKPGHPWLETDNRELLRNLQAWKVDRESDESALTVAGLLMFGMITSHTRSDAELHSRLPRKTRAQDRIAMG